jgi:hypothetical protein
MSFMGVVFLFPSTPNPAVADMNYSVVILGGVMGLSVVYYYLPKYGGIYWFKGPVSTIGKDGVHSGTSSLVEEEKMNEVQERRFE